MRAAPPTAQVPRAALPHPVVPAARRWVAAPPPTQAGSMASTTRAACAPGRACLVDAPMLAMAALRRL